MNNHTATFVLLVTLSSATAGAAESNPSAGTAAATAFQFKAVSDKSLALLDGARPVLVYNHGVLGKSGVPADRNRSTYIHPLYGLDGEVLTDDFPQDHHHHRGLFWAWPHVKIGSEVGDLWMLKGVEQRFERWITQETGRAGARLVVENGWYVRGRRAVRERVSLRAHPATAQGRAIDIELELTPLNEALTLQGAEGKSYGGLTLRFAPREETVIQISRGRTEKDLPMARLPWADLSGKFAGRSSDSGVAIFVAREHPDFPPEWLTRHYGVLCIGWPGVKAKTFPPGSVIRCRYRLWIHRQMTAEQLERVYQKYQAGEAETRSAAGARRSR